LDLDPVAENACERLAAAARRRKAADSLEQSQIELGDPMKRADFTRR
jgi:hypothetical protein